MSDLLHRIFTSRETGAWPEEFDVDTVAHETSPCWAEAAAKRPARAEPRRWLGTARNVVDEKGVERLVSAAPPAKVAPLGKRLSIVAAKGDELADGPLRRRDARVRVNAYAVGALSAKVEQAGKVAARRAKKKRAADAYAARVAAKPITREALGYDHVNFVPLHIGQVVTVNGELRRVA